MPFHHIQWKTTYFACYIYICSLEIWRINKCSQSVVKPPIWFCISDQFMQFFLMSTLRLWNYFVSMIFSGCVLYFMFFVLIICCKCWYFSIVTSLTCVAAIQGILLIHSSFWNFQSRIFGKFWKEIDEARSWDEFHWNINCSISFTGS